MYKCKAIGHTKKRVPIYILGRIALAKESSAPIGALEV